MSAIFFICHPLFNTADINKIRLLPLAGALGTALIVEKAGRSISSRFDIVHDAWDENLTVYLSPRPQSSAPVTDSPAP
jgi:hypothetical protein